MCICVITSHTHPVLSVHLPVDPGYSLDSFVIEPRSFRTELEETQNRHDYENEMTFPRVLPTKQQILNCLSAHGHWVTTQPELQVFCVCLNCSHGVLKYFCTIKY